MKKTILLAFALAGFGVTAFPADQRIAFERNDAVYIANLDGTGEKKIADGIFPAISPDGTRVAFNTVEKTSDNSYYPTWTADGTNPIQHAKKLTTGNDIEPCARVCEQLQNRAIRVRFDA